MIIEKHKKVTWINFFRDKASYMFFQYPRARLRNFFEGLTTFSEICNRDIKADSSRPAF